MKAGIIFVLIVIAGCAGPQAENEAEDVVERAGKDQSLVIQLAANGCVEKVLPPADDNCRDPGVAMRAGCGDSEDCVCAARGKIISWQVMLPPLTTSATGVPADATGVPAEPPAFKILFTAERNPFQRDCTLEASAGREVRCRINRDASGEYEYEVKVTSCTDEYDPRIVIRNFLH